MKIKMIRSVWDRMGSTAAVVDAAGNMVQTTGYYPSGTPYQLPNTAIGTAVDAKTDRLHIGNRWMGHSGLAMYDNTARLHDPLLMRFAAPDPLYSRYPGLSPWSHTHSNPLNFVDYDGEREWPVDESYKGYPARHENNFGVARDNGKRSHKGVDINIGSGNFDKDAPVYATHDGFVQRLRLYNQDNDAGGTRIKISSSDGEISTYYMHLNSVQEGLKEGDFIQEGMQIGTIGGTGKGISEKYTPHLHYEIIVNGDHINPAIDKYHLKDPQTMFNYVITLDEVVVTGTRKNQPNITIPVNEYSKPELEPHLLNPLPTN